MSTIFFSSLYEVGRHICRHPLKPIRLAVYISVSLGMVGCQRANLPQVDSDPITPPASVASIATTATPLPTLKPNVSQQFIGNDPVQQRLAKALPEIAYTTDNLSAFAKEVNQAALGQQPPSLPAASAVASTALATSIDYTVLRDSKKTQDHDKSAASLADPDTALIIKIQALLNWHGHSVGAVTGTMNKNTIKALQVFQQKHQLPVTTRMDEATWAALTQNTHLANQPVLVRYQLTRQDLITTTKPRDMQYQTAREAVAERFHMSQKLLGRLNPDTPLKAGNTIIVYNPYQPNVKEVTKVVSDKKNNLLYAYDATGELVASYPTTVGSNYTPSPSGTLTVKNRVLDPTYNKDFSSKEKWLPPGPNNPVGRVWIGLSKRSFGIHGSPEPEMISQQKSQGCVRLTNWDALGLYGTIADEAAVEFF